MENSNNKDRWLPVSTHVSSEIKTWLENLKARYNVDISTQLFHVVAKMIKSEKQLEKIVVASLLEEHESKGNALRDKASELGIEYNVANQLAQRLVPVVNANVVDVFSKHKTKKAKVGGTENIIKKCLHKNSDVKTDMKSKLEEAVSESTTKVKSIDDIDWQRLASWKYKDLDILGISFEGAKILQEDNLKRGFKNGLYATLHSQALGMWSDQKQDLTIREIAKLQPVIKDNGETRILTIQTIVKRLIKAIVHFGTAEEKKLLFGTSDIFPHKAKKSS